MIIITATLALHLLSLFNQIVCVQTVHHTLNKFLRNQTLTIFKLKLCGQKLKLKHNTLFLSSSIVNAGAIEVSIANMYKEERCATEEVYVVGFVPSHMLPKKRPNSLDPFLEPLVSEIENIFIDGKALL